MKKLKKIFSSIILISITAILYSCNQDPAPSLYMVEPKGSIPVISGLIPENVALAGVSEITISGSNFSSTPEDNYVYFGTTKALVLQASPTALVIKAPSVAQNDLDVKIAVKGVEDFSNITKYSLKEAVGIYYAFAKGIDDPMTVTVDKDENIYIYLKDKGVKKISTSGTISDFAPKGAESFFFDMKFGPNSILYGTRNLRALFQVEAGKATATFVTFPTGNSIVTLDFDENKNIWASGSGGNLFSVTPSKVITAFPIDYTISALRVYNGYLYVAGKNNTEEAIYKYKINSNTSLGTREKYFDIGGAGYGLNKVQVGSMTFSADGGLILGTDLPDAFLEVTNSGTTSSLYPGLINPSARSMIWGSSVNLYYIREYIEAGATLHTLIRVDMQKLSAPYYGIH